MPSSKASSCRSSRRLALLKPELQESKIERAASCGDLSSHSLHGKRKCMTAHKLSSLNTMFGLPPGSVRQKAWLGWDVRTRCAPGNKLQTILHLFHNSVAPALAACLFTRCGWALVQLLLLPSCSCVTRQGRLCASNQSL